MKRSCAMAVAMLCALVLSGKSVQAGVPVPGACCTGEVCEDFTDLTNNCRDGTPHPGVTCAEMPCAKEVPAISTVGLGIMACLMVFAAAFVLRTRRGQPA